MLNDVMNYGSAFKGSAIDFGFCLLALIRHLLSDSLFLGLDEIVDNFIVNSETLIVTRYVF